MLTHSRKLSSMEVSSLAQPLFLKRIMNRTQILSLLLLILITAIPQKLFAEVVTQSFDGNRLAIDVTRKTGEQGYMQEWPEEIEMSEEVKKKVDEKWKKLF